MYVMGVMNLLKIKINHNIHYYANNVVNYSAKFVIDKPKKVYETSQTILNHIYTNNLHDADMQ